MGNPSRRFVLPDRAGVKRNDMSASHLYKGKLLYDNKLQSSAYPKEVLQTQRGSRDGEAPQYRDTRCRGVQVVCKVLWRKGLRSDPSRCRSCRVSCNRNASKRFASTGQTGATKTPVCRHAHSSTINDSAARMTPFDRSISNCDRLRLWRLNAPCARRPRG